MACQPRDEARFVVLHCHDGYTTNLALDDFAAEDALLAHSWSGKPLEAEHGGPVNIAVQEGAKEGEPFVSYVTYLADKGFVPPNGKHWVGHIRKRGNEATHEIALMGENDAKELLGFVEMLLRFIYEFPNMIPK